MSIVDGGNNLQMDLKDLRQYQQRLMERIEKARLDGRTNLLNRLLDLLDSVDMVFDVSYISTITNLAPDLSKVVGFKFDLESLRLAMPHIDSKAITESTQVDIKFDDAVTPTIVSKEEKDEDYITKIKRLMDKGFVSNINEAVKIYVEHSGTDLLPSDAWIEIRKLLKDSRLFPGWDKHISAKFKKFGPIAAYGTIKKNLPDWSDTEISRICEYAVRNVISYEDTPFSTANELQILLENTLAKSDVNRWKADEETKNVIELMIGRKSKEEEIKRKFNELIAVMNPSIREKIEAKHGRKPYVEKGYPAK